MLGDHAAKSAAGRVERKLPEMRRKITAQAATLVSHEGSLVAHNSTLVSYRATLDSHEGSLVSHNSTLVSHRATLDSHEGSIVAHNSTLAIFETRITTAQNAAEAAQVTAGNKMDLGAVNQDVGGVKRFNGALWVIGDGGVWRRIRVDINGQIYAATL